MTIDLSGVVLIPKSHCSDDDCRAYDVERNGRKIGSVEARRSAVWRMAGRLRSTLLGRPKRWHCYAVNGRPVWYAEDTRKAAIAALVRIDMEKMEEDYANQVSEYSTHGEHAEGVR